MRTLALLLALQLPVVAQTTFVLPTPPPPTTNNLPFAGGIVRYQQWFSAAQLGSGMTGPMRLTQVEFLAGAGTQTATTLDMEVAIAHSYPFGPTGQFDSNYTSPRTIVLSRRTVNIVTATAGNPAVTVPFSAPYTWNGVDPLILDIKIFGNGRSNQPFNYFFQATTGTTLGLTTRVYFVGNANATSGTLQANWGIYARFTARPGVNVAYGTGCPGDGGAVPLATAAQVGWPGIAWTHNLTQASSQRPAVWMLGVNRSTSPLGALPLDLGPVIGANGCYLLVNPAVTLWTTTVGGGAGAGAASMTLNLPPLTSYVGMSFYSQWLVADPLAANNMLSASNGVWHVIAPVGG